MLLPQKNKNMHHLKRKEKPKKKKQKTRKENGKASVTKWYALKKEKQLSYFNSRKNA